MAHQADNIPWQVLAANLRYHPYQQQPADFVWRYTQTHARDIEQFAETFVRYLHEDTVTERAKFPATYDTPNPNDTLIDDATAKKINGTVYRWRKAMSENWLVHDDPSVQWNGANALCPHTPEARDTPPDSETSAYISPSPISTCSCPLPVAECKVSAFIRRYRGNDCHRFYEVNQNAFVNIEVAKTLIIHGKMEPLLRTASHPQNDYASWVGVTECHCKPEKLGWEALYRSALDAFLTLNIIACFPELWDSECMKENGEMGGSWGTLMEDEYRNTALYQRLVQRCTWPGESIVPTYPHLDFFGIPERHPRNAYFEFDGALAREWPALRLVAEKERQRQRQEEEKMEKLRSPGLVAFGDEQKAEKKKLEKEKSQRVRAARGKFPVGQVPYDVFLNSTTPVPHLPSAHDIQQVSEILYKKGLPPELIQPIMAMADYDTPQRCLPVPHDPFHPDNRDELTTYLASCWGIIVRYNMLAQELGIKMHWKLEVLDSLSRTVDMRGNRLYSQYSTGRRIDAHLRLFRFEDAQGKTLGEFRVEEEDYPRWI
ncbi:hypothetical protein BDW74DRAFT_112569 [Aspergillus multicolor]|uniref:uncharacterized protein n=1 Tax=Aspergillus multicolor TaxID=41759 RepID=UPI003CCDE01E